MILLLGKLSFGYKEAAHAPSEAFSIAEEPVPRAEEAVPVC
jgi:hypothetical protein